MNSGTISTGTISRTSPVSFGLTKASMTIAPIIISTFLSA